MRSYLIYPLLGCLICLASSELPSASTILDEYKILGFSSTVYSSQGEEMRLEGGRRMAEDSTPIGTTDKWQLGQNSRLITALLVGRMVAQGHIDFSSTAQEILPFDVHPSYENVTLKHLMTESAGLPTGEDMLKREWTFMAELFQLSSFDPDFDNRPLRHNLASHFLTQAKPEELTVGKHAYGSYIGWAIAAHLVETVANKTFEQLVREEVFSLLGMEGCGFGPNTLDPSLPPVQPWGHLSDAFGLFALPIVPGNQAESLSVLVPSNGIHCDMESFGKFQSAHFSQPEDYLPQDMWDTLHSEQVVAKRGERFGYGFGLASAPGLGNIMYSTTNVDTQNSCVNFASTLFFMDHGFSIHITINSLVVEGATRAGAGYAKITDVLIEEAFSRFAKKAE